ncbi:nitrilase-related carbon-nitrogen hydrolase [Propionibacterium sp.]|uniref:nitrilase-related carbon-nitrogen hydrolase n=1 Tax=Propionibacterium sp. TaxID=1977903 RepID=UPI0039E9CA75
MSSLPTVIPSTATDIAYEWLRNFVSKLPWNEEANLSENQVAEESGTSRTAAREALLRLDAIGIIRRVPNRGAQVPALSIADVRTMMETRLVIEEWAVRKCALSGTGSNALTALTKQQKEVSADPIAFMKFDLEFHKLIVHSANNPTLERVYCSQRDQQLRLGINALSHSVSRAEQVVEEHKTIMRCILAGDADGAALATRRHLESTNRAFLQKTQVEEPLLTGAGSRRLATTPLPAPAVGVERTTLRTALVQVASPDTETKAERITRVSGMLDALNDVDLVVLPELWNTGYFHFDHYQEDAEPLSGPTVAMCAAFARSHGCYVHMGSFVERTAEGLIRNTSVLLDRAGSIAHRYSKIHLFGNGSEETEVLTPGDELTIAQLPFARFTSTTCFDLRFPGLWDQIGKRGAELVIVPAAWPKARLDHWNMFSQVRAAESELILVACNASGVQRGEELGGNSRIIGPNGEIVATAGSGEEPLYASIDLQLIDDRRNAFPVLNDRLTNYDNLKED